MKLVSVNVGTPRVVLYKGSTISTGIFKQPVAGRVAVAETNVAGDRQADLSVHGGVDKAVYAYPVEHYDYWHQELGRDDLSWGCFGENFTVQGMLETEICIGDVFRVGDTVVEVSQPRTPCAKLGIRMKMPQFPKRFLQSMRSGFYLRVLQEGQVEAGDSIEQLRRDPVEITVHDIFRLHHYDRKNLGVVRRVLQNRALSNAWREPLQRQLDS